MWETSSESVDLFIWPREVSCGHATALLNTCLRKYDIEECEDDFFYIMLLTISSVYFACLRLYNKGGDLECLGSPI